MGPHPQKVCLTSWTNFLDTVPLMNRSLRLMCTCGVPSWPLLSLCQTCQNADSVLGDVQILHVASIIFILSDVSVAVDNSLWMVGTCCLCTINYSNISIEISAMLNGHLEFLFHFYKWHINVWCILLHFQLDYLHFQPCAALLCDR